VLLAQRSGADDQVGDGDDGTDDGQIDVVELWPLSVPAYVAHNLGLIGRTERDRLVGEARTVTQRRMQAIIASLPDQFLDRREVMIGAMNSPSEFARSAAGVGVRFIAERPVWYWRIRSVAAEVQRGRQEGALAWLADQVFRQHKRALEQSMEDTSRAAFARYSGSAELV
jgi:hypothetical protein